ncbi:MAG: PAS domain S-box protein [Chloroflexi bacterium]|nr:PAS domain S-box protein [Chloroflexota bacterium]
MFNPIRTLLVDDSPYFLEAAQDYLQIQDSIEVVGFAIHAEDALAKSVALNPQVILLDINLGERSGLDLIPLFNEHLPNAKIIVLTIMESESYRAAALQAGAHAFINKSQMHKELMPILESLFRNRSEEQTSGNKMKKITRKKKTATANLAVVDEHPLQVHQRLLESIFNSTMDAIIVIDENQQIVIFNPAAELVFRISTGEVIGQTLDRFMPPDARAKHRELVRAFGESGVTKRSMKSPPLTLTCLRANGDAFPAEISISRLEIIGRKLYAAIIRDVTEHSLLQEALHESEAKFSEVFKHAPIPMGLSAIEDGRLIDVNNRYIANIGLTRDQIIGKTALELGIISPEDHARFAQRMRDQGRFENIEVVVHLKDNRERTSLFSGEVIMINGSPCMLTSAIDITESKRAEAELSYHARLLSNVNDAIVASDSNFRITAWNAAAESMYGWKAEEAIGRNGLEIVQTQWPEADAEKMRSEIAALGRWSGEATQARKDGIRINVEVSSIVLHDDRGQITGYVSVNRDITERKQAEEKFQESEDRYRDLVENSQDLICTHDLEGKLLSANEAAILLTGYSRVELLQMNLADLLTPQTRRFFSAYLKKMQTAGHARGLMQIQTATGETRIWEYNNTLRAEGRTVPIVRGMARDITERKIAEDSLRGSQMQLEGIFNTTMDAIITIDEDQKIVIFNPAAEKMFRCTASEAIGGSLDRFIADYYRDRHKASVRSFGESNLTRRSMNNPALTFISLRADGEEFPSEVSISKLELGGRNLYTAIVRDITERKQAEDEIRRLKDFDENLINNMAEGIVVQNNEGNFSYINPAVTAITGYLPEEFLGLHWTKFIPADQHEIINESDSRRATGQASQYEIDFLHKSGKRVNMLVSGSPLFENGRFNGTMAVFTDITARKQAEEKIHRQINYLTALQDIDRTIASDFDMQPSLNALIAKAVSLLAVDAAAVLLINFNTNALEFAAGDGFQTDAVKTAHVKLGESYAGRAAIEKRIVKFPNPKDESGDLFLTSFLKDEKFVSYFGIPLIIKGEVIGVLEVYQRSIVKRDQEWLDFLNALAGQAAVAISNARLFDNLQNSNKELLQAYDATIEGWSRAMDLRDHETEGHTLRVTEMALRLANLIGISETEQVHVHRGALLHDIGKLGIPDSILLKPGKLTDEEWIIMRQHPVHAYNMLSSIEYLKSALDIPYCHHEKWDGTGYPRGLKGVQIPLVARIFAVVDVWDALLSNRSYRPGWPKEKVFQHIRAESGKHFDPEVVKAFLILTGK